MFGGEVFRREYLALAEAQGPDDLARKHAILYLVRRAFDVSDAEVARGRFDLVDRRRRDDRDAVPLGPMRDRKSTRLNSSPYCSTRMPSSDCKKHINKFKRTLIAVHTH